MTVSEAVEGVRGLSEKAMEQCKRRWDGIAKPLGSLGKLESSLIKIAGITESADISLEKKALVIMCADNGVVEEGVTQTGQEVTAIVSENFLIGRSTAGIFGRETGTDLFPVDIGIARDTKLLNRKIAYGTKNMTKGPAMTRDEAERAVMVGIEMVRELKEKGYRIIATGEMGIGNTTTSSAVAAVLMGLPAETVTGRGAGLSSAGLERKVSAIRRAIEKNDPDPSDGIDVLSKVGGLDLAGLAGVFLGGALYRVPVVIDGFISAAAALAATRICPAARDFMLASHVSREPAAHRILEYLGMEAPLHCDMCLGEGTGALLFFPILSLACAVYHDMSTFQDIQVEAYQPLD